MENTHTKAQLDQSDLEILEILQQEGRISNTALAERIHLSPPACLARVKRLRARGIIRGYHAQLDRSSLGLDNLCFIELSLELHQPEHMQQVLQRIVAMPEVLECYHLTGEYDYLLKVLVANTEALHDFISRQLIPMPGIARIHTSVVLREIKTSTNLPL